MLSYKIINGADDAPWFVFIPGFTGVYEVWKSTCHYLPDNNNYLLIDNLGAGESPQPSGKYTTEIMAKEIIAVLAKLDLHDINLIGHSLGGAIAQKIAIIVPNLINHLYLLATFSRLDNVARFFLTGRYELAKSNLDKRLIALSSIPSIFGNEFLADSKNLDLAIARVMGNPQTLDGMYGQLHACLDHDSQNELSEINSKTIIITGKDDVLVNPRHSNILHSGIKNSSLFVIENVGHMLPLEQPQKLAKLLIQTL